MSAFAIFALLMFVVGVVGTIWVFADASVNSSQSAVLWGLVALFGGVLGILLYVLLGRDEVGGSNRGGSQRSADREWRGPPSHVCQSCGEEYYIDEDVDIYACRSCGGIKVERA